MSSTTSTDSNKTPHLLVILVGALIMVMGWVADAALDAVFHGEKMWDEVFSPSPYEISIRGLFIFFQLLFLLYIARCMSRSSEQQRRLASALLAAELEKQKSQALMDAVGDAISIQDTQMKVLYQNRAHQELMGAHLGEYCYKAYQNQERVCEGCHLLRSFQDGETHCREVGNVTREGKKRYVEIISTPFRDPSGTIVGGIEAVRDISERKRVELEIFDLNRKLADRADKLTEANRELEAFSYSLSHDLRSYITRISTAHQVLETMVPANPEGAFAVQVIGQSCQGMEDLIEAMLTLSQVSRKGMVAEEVNLSDLAKEISLHLQQQELARYVEFKIAPDLVVRGDRYLLKLALKNLIENAWKYTRDAAEPFIEFGVTEQEGIRFFFVRDNGIGFSMNEKDKLFAPFQRLQNSRGYYGNGIGLATVERVVLRHGGEVRGVGEPGKGATIYFHLPDLEEP